MFESILMQMDSDSLALLIPPVAGILTAIGSILAYYASTLSAKAKDNQQAKSTSQAFERASTAIREIGALVSANQKNFIDAVKALERIDGVKPMLQDSGVNSKALAEDLEFVEKQLERIAKTLPCLENKDELKPE